MPLFSILIPTRNRAPLLKSALQSLRRQTFDDFEVIVSDDHSADDTPQVVAGFGDARFRLVHPSTPLTMAEHYDFVASQARGEYVNFLPDRSVLYQSALSELANVIAQRKPPLLAWNNDRYDDVTAEDRKLHQYCRTGRLVDYPSEDLLRLHFDFHLPAVNFSVASPASSACHRSVVEKVRAASGGRLVFPCIPDITYSVSVLLMVSTLTYYDRSLSVGAGYSASIGANLSRTREQGFQRLTGANHEAGQRTPCKGLLLNANLVADDLLMLKEMHPQRLEKYNLNYVRYFEKMLVEIINIESGGGEATKEWEGFEAGLRHMPSELRLHMGNLQWTQKFRQSFATFSRERIISCGGAPVLEAIAWSEANPFR
jgi:hypothetical protein